MAQWRAELSPWTDALRGRLSLPIQDAMPHRSALYEQLWIQLQVPVAPIDTPCDSILWVEALRQLDLLATVDRRAYWELIVDLCNAHEQLRKLGCPLELLVSMRPRYELHCAINVTPLDAIMAHLLDRSVHKLPAGSQLETRLLAVSRPSQLPCRPPVQLRFHFSVPMLRGVPAYSGLKQVLTWAGRIASLEGMTTSIPFMVESLGLSTQSTGPDAREIVRQIACKMPLHSLTMNYSSNLGDLNLYGPFLWRQLAPHANIRAHLGLSSLTIDTNGAYQNFYHQKPAALLSAVASSRTLRELSFHEAESAFGSHWCQWLAFALFSRTAQHEIHTVQLTLGTHMKDYVNAIKELVAKESNTQDGNTIAYLVDWPPTVVRVNPHTRVFGFDLPQDYTAKTVYHGKRPVDCLVSGQNYGSAARILIPGVGYGCIERHDVTAEIPATLRETHPIRHLTLGVHTRRAQYQYQYGFHQQVLKAHPFDAASVVEMLRLVGGPLLSLTLRSVGAEAWDPLRVDDILVCCPDLQRLTLVNLTLSVEKLFASKHGQALQSLALLDCNVLDNARRLRNVMDVYVPSFVFPRLTSLFVNSAGRELHEYVLEIAAQRNLHRLVVKCSDETMRARYAAHVQRHDGESIPVLALRQKLAFLSVVAAGPTKSSTAKYALSMDVSEMIFAMASTTMRRRVCTLLD